MSKDWQYRLQACRVTFILLQIMITFITLISSASHSFSGWQSGSNIHYTYRMLCQCFFDMQHDIDFYLICCLDEPTACISISDACTFS